MKEASGAPEKKLKKPRGKVRLLPNKCIACGARCESECPADSISMNEKGEPVIDLEKCIACRKCVKVCPAGAIEHFYNAEELAVLEEMKKSGALKADKDEEVPKEPQADQSYRGVWVFIEQEDGIVAPVSWELLGVGAKLAKDLDVDLSAFVFGSKIDHLINEAFCYGAKKVYCMDQPILRHYRTEPYLRATVELIRKHKPEVVLIGATGLGRDLAGAVATVLETGLTADCTDLTIDREHRLLEQTRPAFGGNIMATILNKMHRPQMASVRPHVMPMPERTEGATGQVIWDMLDMTEDDIKTKVLEVLYERNSDHVDISGMEVLVAGGRGMLGPENFKLLDELAALLKGTTAASRASVDAGWMPYERQVGQTGKTVRPKLYFACGISGAIQHLVGMQDSELIIALNRDRAAPIFEVAHYGIVGDLFAVVPAIVEELREFIKDEAPYAKSPIGG
ncbi:MAG: electron transfer flavoprotein subunit alpha [Spirochaetes bacterium]|nr:MAG: electron transfer flavoprotein subunit alpha [Spirochaetota bacterium]